MTNIGMPEGFRADHHSRFAILPMIPHEVVERRSSEVKTLIDSGKLQRAVRRLLDFVRDFSKSPHYLQEAIEVNEMYLEIAQQAKDEEILVEDAKKIHNDLYHQMLGIYENVLAEQREIEKVEEEQAVQRASDTVYESQSLGKSYRRNNFALEDINLKLDYGEITGVVGENGNGKTTLFRLVSGDLLHDSGAFRYPAIRNYHSTNIDWVEVKQHISYVPQELSKWYGSLQDNLHYEAAIHGIKGEKNTEAVSYIVHRLGLAEHLGKKWSQLSGGYKLRFTLARALVWNPKLLVIDEPLANLDINAQMIVLNDLRDLVGSIRFPLTILISSQHLHEIESVSDNILFLEKGKVLYYGKTGEFGKSRATNTFELSSKISLQDLEKALGDFNYVSVDHTGLAFIIDTPVEVTKNELLQKLVTAGVDVEYFRDISQSTKKLFV